MTSLLKQVSEEDSTTKDTKFNYIREHQYRHVLYIKEKKVRPKCKKVLKRKLKKYKLRQDGKEDQEILDVLDILETSLNIKSPSEEKTNADLELELLRPPNYLFKMGRKKQAVIVSEKTVESKTRVKINSNNSVVQLSPTTEEKKQTNAFKLLMDSRNKSLGGNSPGKEKPMDEMEIIEIIEKKNNKAKRTLVLQKMAESKGSLKKKEIEENQEQYINKKMEKRAERLKNMISNIEPKMSTKAGNEKIVSKSQNGRRPLNSLKTEKNEKNSDKSVKTLQLVNMFTDVEQKVSPERKLLCKEDEEFLNKLSPSLKKKESMLSYFKIVEKEVDCTLTDSENNIIKVKLGTKLKKKTKKKLSLNKGNFNTLTCEVKTKIDQTSEDEEFLGLKPKETDNEFKTKEIKSKERRKRKREIKTTHLCDDGAVSSSNILDSVNDGRPRRSTKRPVKYEDSIFSSSDDLHIFTPKKKKHSDSINNVNKTVIVDISSDSEIKTELLKKCAPEIKEKKMSKETDKKLFKLAPIFSAKTQLDQAAIEAKQKFLHSGVPEKLKKIMMKQSDKNIISNCFLKVVHIQQLNEVAQSISAQLSLNELDISIDNQENIQDCEDLSLKTLLSITSSQRTFSISSKHINAQTVLQNLKEKYPRYPVYRTYRLLRGKKKGDYKVGKNYLDLDNSVEILNASIDNQEDNPKQLNWSDKYKPSAASQIIGNFESVKELRKWLVLWTENDMKSKATNGNGSDSSDYYQSDCDSKDSVKSSNNLLVLSGPVGSGKTSSVYAIAAELAIKVIEVNASSKRTGKIMLQDLQEATQSHKVNRQASSNENSQSSQTFEIIETIPVLTNAVKKRGRPKKISELATQKKTMIKKTTLKEKLENVNGLPSSQDTTRTCMSLILIDDADIVFDQDDGFCSAIGQLVHSSKRPVILITSSLSCPHLQRFIQSSRLLKMNPLLPNTLGTWLDIMCLADSGICWPGVGSKLLNIFKGDIRKTINCLQFYVCSQEQAITQDNVDSQNTDCRVNVDGENSNMSWADRDGDYKNLSVEPFELNDPSQSVMHSQLHSIQYKSSTELFNIWWNVPKLLNIKDHSNQTERLDSATVEVKSLESLESICKVLDSISLCDFYNKNPFKNKGDMASDPWFSEETHSVSELENFDKYDRHHGTIDEIEHELLMNSISIAQTNFGCLRNIDMDFPGMSQQRQRDRIVLRHNNLTSYLSPQAVLDRKAVALDYWSTCRTICRIEKSKTDTNSKRNNRFCHYLKSLSVLCKNDSFDKLAVSLCPSDVRNDTTELS